MKARYAVLVAIAAGVTLTSVAAAAPEAAKQRVAITAKGMSNPTSFGKFVLTPLRAGPVEPDTGTETSTASDRFVTREGQRIDILNWVTTSEGKRGSFVIRSRVEYVDAGNGYSVGLGTWKFVRGTGQYAQIAGSGWGGHMFTATGPWSDRYEGFLALP